MRKILCMAAWMDTIRALAKANPRWKWLLAALAAAVAAIVVMIGGCTSIASVEPDGAGGWTATTTVHVSGSRTVLPNGTAPKPPTTPTTQPGS